MVLLRRLPLEDSAELSSGPSMAGSDTLRDDPAIARAVGARLLTGPSSDECGPRSSLEASPRSRDGTTFMQN